MVTVTKMENVLASLALMKTSVEYVPRDFMDFHAAKVFIKFQFFQKIYYFLFIVYFMSFIECNCDQDGSKSDNCDDVGKCSCKPGFDGDKCEKKTSLAIVLIPIVILIIILVLLFVFGYKRYSLCY